MSTLEDLDDMEREEKEEKKDDGDKDGKKPDQDGDAEMKDADGDKKEEEKEEDIFDPEILHSSTRDIITRRRLLENDMRIMKSEFQRLTHEQAAMKEKIKDNLDKIENNRYVLLFMPFLLGSIVLTNVYRQLPYLVGNVVELLDLDVEKEAAEEGANIDLDATRIGKSAVIKTSTRQTIFLPLIGLVDHTALKPGDLIGVNKDSYLVLDTLPAEYDSRVKAMEVDEKPTEKYTDVGGLDKQIEELVEAIVWPMKEAERFKKIGIKAPKGTLTSFIFLTPTKVSMTDPSLPTRSTHVRPPRNWQDPPRPSLRRPNRRHLSQTRRPPTRPNVHRRRCQARPRLLRPRQRESPLDHLHRRARRRRHETVRQRKERGPRSPTDDAGTAQPTRRLRVRRPGQGPRGHEPRRRARPSAPPFGPSGPQDRVPAPQRGSPGADFEDPQPQNDGRRRGQLARAGAEHGRVRRRAAQGRVRRGRHDCVEEGDGEDWTRALRGRHRGGAGEEEGGSFSFPFPTRLRALKSSERRKGKASY